MTLEQIDNLCTGAKILHNDDVLHVYSIIYKPTHVVYANVGHSLVSQRLTIDELLRKSYVLLPNVPVAPADFISQVQDWFDKDYNHTVRHIVIMSKDGHVSCRLSQYARENVQVLSNLYVDRQSRDMGYCDAILDYVDSTFKDRQTLVYVDSYAQQFVRDMYDKRGYLIMNSGE